MDKFEESLKKAKEAYKPNAQFVDQTMSRIQGKQKHLSLKIWLPSLAGGLAVIAVIILLPLSAHNSTTNKTQQTAQQSSTSSLGGSNGTSNASLDSGLNSIQGALNQENSDQNTTNTTINDSQYQITVPTT